jgi:phospholipase D1/2
VRRILVPGSNCWLQAEAEQAGVLVDARDYYRAFYRAARRARQYIAILGWQFDSDVALLRGEDAQGVTGETRMLPLLRELCLNNPELQVHILAWDFSLLLALEREWMQQLLFNWHSERISFRFDASAPLSGAHHQKLVIIDGQLAFTGGMDICDCRWDDRSHLARSTLRCDSGRDPHGPYHDVQAVLKGPAVRPLVELFEARWFNSGGGPLKLPEPVVRDDVEVEATLPFPPGPVALSRTFGKTLVPFCQAPVQEIRALYLDAIQSAERLIYIENQYFSSRAIFQALVRRMRDKTRGPLQILFVLPRMPEALREQLAMGVAQVRMLRVLQRVAQEHGHALGVYCSASPTEEGQDKFTYIHSKLMMVDDRFLTVGSANTTNRSMGLDSELNLAWEASEGPEGAALRRSLRRLRVSLLAEHIGLQDREAVRRLARAERLVAWLDDVAAGGKQRLRLHPLETVFDQSPLLKPLEPEELIIDPEDSLLDPSFFESLRQEQGLFATGFRLLTRWFIGLPSRPHPASLPAEAAPAEP